MSGGVATTSLPGASLGLDGSSRDARTRQGCAPPDYARLAAPLGPRSKQIHQSKWWTRLLTKDRGPGTRELLRRRQWGSKVRAPHTTGEVRREVLLPLPGGDPPGARRGAR